MMMKSNSSQLSVSRSNQLPPNATLAMRMQRMIVVFVGKCFSLGRKFKKVLWISTTGLKCFENRCNFAFNANFLRSFLGNRFWTTETDEIFRHGDGQIILLIGLFLSIEMDFCGLDYFREMNWKYLVIICRPCYESLYSMILLYLLQIDF